MLRYTGSGYGGFLPGIPARDLSDEEVMQYGGEELLVQTGLYTLLSNQPVAKPVHPQTGEITLANGVSDDEASLAARALNARKGK